MINALFSSKASGTKSFILDGVEFGWSAIEMLYERECNRVIIYIINIITINIILLISIPIIINIILLISIPICKIKKLTVPSDDVLHLLPNFSWDWNGMEC